MIVAKLALIAGWAIISGCAAQPVGYDFQDAYKRINAAIAEQNYAAADFLIDEYESAAAGEIGVDGRLLRWVVVKAKLGHYQEALALLDQLDEVDPDSPYCDYASMLRPAIEKRKAEADNPISGK